MSERLDALKVQFALVLILWSAMNNEFVFSPQIKEPMNFQWATSIIHHSASFFNWSLRYSYLLTRFGNWNSLKYNHDFVQSNTWKLPAVSSVIIGFPSIQLFLIKPRNVQHVEILSLCRDVWQDLIFHCSEFNLRC